MCSTPLSDAVVTTRNDPAARKELESQLLAVLQGNAPRDAKDFVCRQLRTIGTAASVPALEQLLPDAELSHMARYALERIPSLRPARPWNANSASLTANSRSASSLPSAPAVRGSACCDRCCEDSDEAVARAAAIALGRIASVDADKALGSAKPRPALAVVFADASMACAEKLLATGHAKEAKATYQRLLKNNPPELVRLAAERGLKACQTA